MPLLLNTCFTFVTEMFVNIFSFPQKMSFCQHDNIILLQEKTNHFACFMSSSYEKYTAYATNKTQRITRNLVDETDIQNSK